MKEFRIFIENLPETLSEPEIQSTFSNYGEVISVEIKERKIVTNKHTSCFFAYVNLKTTDEDLQTCFQEFSETEWCGQYVKLRIAKESFLERLKREREEKLLSNDNKAITADLVDQSSEICYTKPTSSPATKSNIKKLNELPIVKDTNIHTTSIESSYPSATRKSDVKRVNESPIIQEGKYHKKEISSSSESSDEEETTSKKEENTNTVDVDNDILIVKRPKKEAKFVNGLLKIESFGKTPIAKISTKNEKILDNRQAESEAKRKKAVQDKIRAYHQQKKQFSSFLTRPKIIKFNDDDDVVHTEGSNNTSSESKKMKLFDSDSECDEQQEQKIIEDKIKRDDRFILDSRFEEKQDGSEENTNEENDSKILEEVLGSKVNSRKRFSQNEEKPYIRYDPTNPEHEKYVKNGEETYNTKSSKKKKIHNEKKAEIKEAEPVSSGRSVTFHKDYKSLMENTSGFSLRQLFDTDKVTEEAVDEEIPLPRRDNLTDQNPFKYDSSDEEDETEQIQEEKPVEFRQPKKVWTEPLFLQDDDFRFQEGLDFVKRIAERKKEEGQFEEERRKFKQIVRTKIRNIKKKKEKFTKKLGGNRKKKLKRINKALNR